MLGAVMSADVQELKPRNSAGVVPSTTSTLRPRRTSYKSNGLVEEPSDDSFMPWSDIQVLQDRLREADDALDRALAEAAKQKRIIRLGRWMPSQY
jgi:hypothetical protein